MSKKISLTQDNILFLSSVVIIALGQLANKMNSNALLLLPLMIATGVSFLLQCDYLLPFLFFLIAPNRLLTLGPISAPTIIMLVGIVRSKLTFRKSFFLEAFLLCSYSLLTIFIDSPIIFDTIKTVLLLLFINQLSLDIDANKQFQSCMKSVIEGCIVSFILSALLDPNSFKETNRFAFSSNGQNVLGILCAVLAISLIAEMVQKGRELNLKIGLSLGAILMIGLLTGSRSFLLAVAVGAVSILTIELLRINVGKAAKMMAICVVVCFIAFAAYSNSTFIHGYVDKMIYRMTKLQNNDVSNGRYNLWWQYLKFFRENPVYLLFGNMNPQNHGIDLVAHNMIIEQIADFGIVGSIIVVIMYIDVFLNILRENLCKISWRYLLPPLLAFLSASMVSHTLLGVPQTMIMYMCFIGAINKRRERV